MVFLSPECRYMHRFFVALRSKPIRKETHTHIKSLFLFFQLTQWLHQFFVMFSETEYSEKFRTEQQYKNNINQKTN